MVETLQLRMLPVKITKEENETIIEFEVLTDTKLSVRVNKEQGDYLVQAIKDFNPDLIKNKNGLEEDQKTGLYFCQTEKGNVDIYYDKNKVGHMFTPASEGELNTVQICGFDELYDLWGCGIFGDKQTKNMKKDVQLIFSPYEKMDSTEVTALIKTKVGEYSEKEFEEMQNHWVELNEKTKLIIEPPRKEKYAFISRFSYDQGCIKCYNIPCTCENKEQRMPYSVKSRKDIIEKIIKKETKGFEIIIDGTDKELEKLVYEGAKLNDIN